MIWALHEEKQRSFRVVLAWPHWAWETTRSDLTLKALHPLLLDLGHTVGSHSVSDSVPFCTSVLHI